MNTGAPSTITRAMEASAGKRSPSRRMPVMPLRLSMVRDRSGASAKPSTWRRCAQRASGGSSTSRGRPSTSLAR